MTLDDPMWNEFQPLWRELLLAGDQVHLAGGYGLFLKQRWLLANRESRHCHSFGKLAGCHAASDERSRHRSWTCPARDGRGSKERSSTRWSTTISKSSNSIPVGSLKNNSIRTGESLVDLHAELPESENPNLALDKLRVKHKPSLGDEGVHGTTEPAGCRLQSSSIPVPRSKKSRSRCQIR